MHILVVEDDIDIQQTLKDLLLMEGYVVSTANNGQEALELLKVIPRPCVILLDLMMPVMDGWTFLQKVKKDANAIATIPVLVVSAVADKSNDLNAAGYIKKPVDLDALMNTIENFCYKHAFGHPNKKSA